jgi:hypothetical protein
VELFILEVFIIWASWLGFTSIGRVIAQVLQIVVNLSNLIIHLLIILRIFKVWHNSIIFLIWSIVHIFIALIFQLWTSTNTLIFSANVTIVGIDDKVGQTSGFI